MTQRCELSDEEFLFLYTLSICIDLFSAVASGDVKERGNFRNLRKTLEKAIRV